MPVADEDFSLVEFTNMKDGWDEVVRDCANVAIECQILEGQELKQEIFQFVLAYFEQNLTEVLKNIIFNDNNGN